VLILILNLEFGRYLKLLGLLRWGFMLTLDATCYLGLLGLLLMSWSRGVGFGRIVKAQDLHSIIVVRINKR